jgi:tetratricopeptide (TPR) repeat protein
MKSSLLWQTLRLLLLPFCLGLALNASGSNKEQLIRLGDGAYQRRAYDSAVFYYEQAAAGKSPDAVALYKLGNAHYRLRHIGEAMLSYGKALKQRPGFAAAEKNIRVIQQQVSPARDKEVFFMQWWRHIASPSLSNVWALLAILLFTSVLGLLALSHYSRKKISWLRPQVVIVGLIASALFAALAFSAAWSGVPKSEAVVMRPDAKFLPLTGDAKGTGLSLPEGLLVKVLHTENDKATIALPDGQEGFVQRFDIAVVE